ncbi:hypothetical protein [Ilyobacter sp.]|uniref:hypothetical protein n=1 Tax=Ilyobacter sp. TaxID=3100343 RepID=UPI0035677F84
MANMDVMERLKKQSGSFKQKTQIKKVQVTDRSLALKIPEENIDGNFELTSDATLNSFFRNKATELKMIEGVSKIELGRILQEVFEEISGKNQYDEGLYEKFLFEANFNKQTALRYRKRYNLFSTVNTDHGKGIVAILNREVINEIYKLENEEKKSIIKKIEEGLDKNSLEKLLIEKKETIEKEEKPVIPFYKNIFSFEKKISKMNKEETNKAREEIKSIIKEAIRLEKILENFETE